MLLDSKKLIVALMAIGIFATDIAAAQSAGALEEIVVTARKRSETILEVPLSIQAFTANDLNRAGMVELESLAGMTPNLDFQNLGNAQAGRYNTAIRFRGMDTAITVPTNQTGAFFVDGVNVLGGASSVLFPTSAESK